MDDLGKKLKTDAERIEVAISPQLDDRIRASLGSASQDPVTPIVKHQSATFWWASSLTGVAATVAFVAFVNLGGPEPDMAVTEPPPAAMPATRFEWNLQPAVLTQSLEQELADIQSDLKKAEQVVRDDLQHTGVRALSEKGL